MAKNDFDKLYDGIVKNAKADFIEARINNDTIITKKKKKFGISIGILLIIESILIYFLAITKNLTVAIIFCLVLIVIIGLLLSLMRFSENKPIIGFNELYKTKVIKPIINHIWRNAKYDYGKCLPEEEYNANLFQEDYSIYESDDYVELIDDNCCFAEVNTKTTNNAGENTRYITCFNGIAGVKKLNKNINCTFSVVSNYTFSIISPKPFDIDNTKFNEYYDIFMNDKDKLKIFEILTPDVMQDMLDKIKSDGITFDFAIANDKLYFKIYIQNKRKAASMALFSLTGNTYDSHELFECNYDDPLNKDDIYESYETFQSVKNVICFLTKITEDADI